MKYFKNEIRLYIHLYKIFSKDIAINYLNNCIKYKQLNNYEYIKNLPNILTYSFIFNHTPQGFEYWNNIYNKLIRNDNTSHKSL